MVRLTLQVTDITAVWGLSFRYILVYRSDTADGTYTYVGSVPLVNGTSSYTFEDATGTCDQWYKSRYSNTVPPPDPSLLSGWSDAVRGDEPVLFNNVTYPPESSLSTADDTRVKKIRVYIGDKKELIKSYSEECKAAISENGHTFEMSQKGWPLYISLNDIEKTSASDPYVDGWRYITFSGTVGENDTLEIWYETFRWADSEIVEHYDNAMIPPGLTTTTVTADHLILQASIDLLEAENWRDYIENGSRIQDSDTEWDPSPGFRARESAIKRLQKRLDELVKQYKLVHDGCRID